MERHHHTRIPVHLNAVLIGKHTVPKGCRVRNVSQQGMMLNCEADGRTLTIKHNDDVDIHLLFQDNNGCRYLTKTANVRHVNENSIGVEFLHPDTELVELLKACNVVENPIPDEPAANDQEIHKPATPVATAMPDNTSLPAAVDTTREQVRPGNRKSRLAYGGIAASLAAVCIAAAVYIQASGIRARLDTLESMVNTHSNELEIIKVAPPATTDALDTSIADLKLRMEALAESFAALEQRLAQTDTGSTMPVAHADTAIENTESAKPEPAGAESTEKAATDTTGVKRRISAAANTFTAPVESTGPWVINLISSPDQAAAGRFRDRALAQDIPVEQTKAEINGKVYWRLQVTGFSSAGDARSHSTSIKEKLGIKDVWIYKQAN